MKEFNIKGLEHVIWEILEGRKKESGGILSFEELFSVFHRSSIQSLITKHKLKKILQKGFDSLDLLKFQGARYVAIKPNEATHDQKLLLKFAETHDYITLDMIQKELGWRDIHIIRMIEYLSDQGRVRKADSYKEGARFYFVQLPNGI